MKLETFFEKFDAFAGSPDAVAKMRELVLELAVQGKLVPQDQNDEPASQQLARISAQKAQTGRVARTKTGRVGSSSESDATTPIPSGWAAAPLADLVTVLNGRAYSKDELLDEGTPVLRVGNLFTSNHWYYSDLQLEPDKYCDSGDLIFAWSASFGPFIWQGPKVIYHYHIWKLGLHSERDLNKSFLYWFLQNKTQEIKRAGHGVSMLHMTKEKMERLEVLVPPLAEQKRIVAKVDELMALCDRLEAQQQERETRHAALARASLARFADAPTPANLDLLFHKSYSISPADLRKSILTLAVQGKLVPQEPSDESAEKLQVRIFEEKKRLLAEGKFGRDKNWMSDDDLQPAFEIPSSWLFTTLAEIGLINPRNDARDDQDASFVPMKLISAELGVPHEHEIRKWVDIKTGFTHFAEGDVSLAKITPCFENCKSVVMRNLVNGIGAGTTELHVVRPIFVEANYVLIFLKSSFFIETGIPKMTGTAGQKRVPTTYFAASPFPLPPLAEQRRIVAKVDELMALVDALETQLAIARAAGATLVEAAVAELTAHGVVKPIAPAARAAA